MPWPVLDDLDNLAHIGTLAFCWTEAQFVLSKAVTRTIFASCQTLLEDRSLVQVLELSRRDRHGCPAGAVEQKQACHQIGEIDLITGQINAELRDKFLLSRPRAGRGPPVRLEFGPINSEGGGGAVDKKSPKRFASLRHV